ncbi:MAG: radical SAM protein [Candidatus Methanoperedens sp.]|nr:radical SAM protein [Candidatus Methanoperedens sp.]
MNTSPLSGPWRITFDTNPDDCNLNCIMCEEHSEYCADNNNRKNRRQHRLMDIELIRQTVEQMAPRGLREMIPSTMGEPLLYRYFEDIVRISSKHGIKINLTTNGTWPRLGPQKWAEMLCPVTSDIKISWNGASPSTQEAIMPGSLFSQRLDDIYAFIKVRDDISRSGGNHCRLTFQCTFMETNLDELPDIIRLAADLGVERVKGHHLWVHSPQMQYLDMRRSAGSRSRWNMVVERCKDVAEHLQLPDGKNVILANFIPLAIEGKNVPDNWVCPFLGQEAWVNYEGRFDPCCAPDAKRRELGMFGYVTDGGMEAIWNGTKYRRFVQDHMKYPLCRGCNMRRPPEEVRCHD